MMLDMKFSRPLTVRVVALAYLLSPLANVLQAAATSGHSTDTVLGRALTGFGLAGTALVLGGPLAGIGLYSGQRWGFVVFFAHSFGLLVDSAFKLGSGSFAYRSGILLVDLAVFTAIALVLREDIRAPFLSPEERGWRLGERIPVHGEAQVAVEPGADGQVARAPRAPVDGDASISVDGVAVAVSLVNISRTGLLVRWPSPLPPVGTVGRVEIPNAKAAFRVRVVRLTEDGAGLAFVDADPKATEAAMIALVGRR